MNPSFLIGLALAMALMLFGSAYDGSGLNFAEIALFGNLTGLVMVVGGTIAALLASFPLRCFAQIPKHFAIITGKSRNNPVYYIDKLSTLSEDARNKGILVLEEELVGFDDKFLRDSVMMVVDALEPEKVRERINTELAEIENRHVQTWALYEKGAALAPAFGMVGTLIGLVRMLAGVGDGAEIPQLAGSMAFAILATLYGMLLANLVFSPISNQLRIAHEDEMLCKGIVAEGVISIQAGESPRSINEKLCSYLAESRRGNAISLEKNESE